MNKGAVAQTVEHRANGRRIPSTLRRSRVRVLPVLLRFLRAIFNEPNWDRLNGFLLALALLSVFDASAQQIVPWHDEKGWPVSVYVNQSGCPDDPKRGCVFATVYIGGNARRLRHELAHIAGMRHTAWVRGPSGECATVTVAGHQTGYEVGDVLCAGFDGDDINWGKR